ncbi:MAG: DUF5684 domain-containing protein [Patescibacteria group bacterium]|nr:DUF5684 domain-containing protein [Patescibacteria group bacterium]
MGNPSLIYGQMYALAGSYMIFLLALYVYMAICLQTIAKKTNTENGWFAWIPILNLVLMLQIAGKPVWWVILFFIPIVNLFAAVIIGIIAWMAIAVKCGKPSWWGIMVIIPLMNIIMPGYLAFSKK